MAQPPKTPPRFVPTLTEVVQVADAPLPQGAVPISARTTVMSSPMPAGGARPAGSTPGLAVPRPVPSPSSLAAARAPAALAPGFAHSLRAPQPAPIRAQSTTVLPVAAPAMVRPLPDGMEEYMVHRVMQRVDVVLDQRLREAIATVVQEQTRSVLPRLREEIESVVRHAVYEAVADELASGMPPATKG